MLINYFFVFLSSLLIGVVATSLFKKISLQYKILMPKGITLVGGISMGLTVVLIFFIFKSLFIGIKGIFFASFVMLVFGILDDWKELSVWAKFLVQIIATSLLILFGIRTQIVYIGEPINIIITFIWVVGITNAFNLLDIVDGLAAGTAIIISLAFFAASLSTGGINIAFLSIALSGIIFSFLVYNLPPAKVYMGNSGSHFLGFILAAVALSISYAPIERKAALLSPLFILALPIIDTAFLILIRLSKKLSPFKKSNDHLVMRFMYAGFSKKKALLIMLILELFFSFCGVSLIYVPNRYGLMIIGLVIFIGLAVSVKMARVKING